jgi:ATP-dependent RNA helicase HelY
LRAGTWKKLAPAELAAVVSAVVYESRGGDGPSVAGSMDAPTERLRRALAQTRRVSSGLRADEQRHRIDPSREPDEGFVAAVYRWASTGDLAASLAASDPEASGLGLLPRTRDVPPPARGGRALAGNGTMLSAGDFVRWCRQVIDLLDQLRNAAPDAALRTASKRAIDDIRRGVVAVDGG